MFRKIPYVAAELNTVGERATMMGIGTTPVLNTPVTARANFDAMFYEGKPFWFPSIRETVALHPAIYNDTLGRGRRQDITDIFGVKWKFVESAGGSITESGIPLMEDVNEWKEKIKLPDIDAWDWEAAAKENPIDTRFPAYISFVNGFWFERLISFMDFMGAAMALVDEDQADAIKELFGALTDLGCRLVDKVCTYWPDLDLIEVHDDWGAQKAPFFSLDIANEFFVPCMKKFTDRVHSWGRKALLHSCGHNAERIQCYIDAGFDLWSPQAMNDIEYLYDTYGDKIVLGVWPLDTNLAEKSEEEQRAAARRFVDRFSAPGKCAVLGMAGIRAGTPVFDEEVYRYSREKYAARG